MTAGQAFFLRLRPMQSHLIRRTEEHEGVPSPAPVGRCTAAPPPEAAGGAIARGERNQSGTVHVLMESEVVCKIASRRALHYNRIYHHSHDRHCQNKN